jgi:hypothetical protein
MAADLFSSSSETIQKTFAQNQQIGASDQAVVFAPRRSGNSVVKLGRDATYNAYYGIDDETFFERLERILGLRAEQQVAAGATVATNNASGKLGIGNWILIGVGVVGLGLAIFWKGKK